MVGLNSVATGIPVADLTYHPGPHTLPEYATVNGVPFSENRFSANQFSPEVLAEVQSAPNNSPPGESPSQTIASYRIPENDASRSLTMRHYERLGATHVQKLENADAVLFDVQRFPYSDVGACELAIVVLSQLRSAEALSKKPVIVHIHSVDREYYAGYSGQQEAVHALYPCCLLDQALPIGTPFKLVSDDADLLAAWRDSGYHTFVAESVDQALLQNRSSWRQAGSFGEEPTKLSTHREALESGLSALESRRASSLGSAKAFVRPNPVVGQVPDQSQAILPAA